MGRSLFWVKNSRWAVEIVRTPVQLAENSQHVRNAERALAVLSGQFNSTCGGLFLIVARGSKLPRPDRSAVADFHCRWVQQREPDFKGQLLRAHTESQGTAKRARRFGYPPKLKRLVKLLGWPWFWGNLCSFSCRSNSFIGLTVSHSSEDPLHVSNLESRIGNLICSMIRWRTAGRKKAGDSVNERMMKKERKESNGARPGLTTGRASTEGEPEDLPRGGKVPADHCRFSRGRQVFLGTRICILHVIFVSITS